MKIVFNGDYWLIRYEHLDHKIKEHIYNLALWLIPVCIICARAYYVIFEWDNYKNDLLSVFVINRGGLAIYGGVLGGVAVALIYCKVKRISFWSLADTLMLSLLFLLPGIRVSQVLSGCLVILGIVILFIIRKRQEVRQ